MNKIEELEQQLAEIQKELEELKAKPKSLLSKPNDCGVWHKVISEYSYEGFKGSYGPVSNASKLHHTAFAEPYAEDYARAFNTFLALRHCEGSEPAVDEKTQWCIYYENGLLCVAKLDYLVTKINRRAVFFRNKDSATSAIKTVGEDNIIHMMKTFAGVFEE